MCGARLMRRAASTLPPDREVLHVLPHEFLVDAQDGIRDPIGMVGPAPGSQRSSGLLVGCRDAKISSPQRIAREILISDTVLESLASAESCLTQDKRDLGCCLLDVEAAQPKVIVYGGGVVRHTSAVPVGGDHFTNDLAVGLRTPIPEAERSSASTVARLCHAYRDSPIHIASVGDRPPRTIFARQLTDIIERAPRIACLDFVMICSAPGSTDRFPAGFVLRGGGAKLTSLIDLAEQYSICPCASPSPKDSPICPSSAQPEYATVVVRAVRRESAAGRRRNVPEFGVAHLSPMFASGRTPPQRCAGK